MKEYLELVTDKEYPKFIDKYLTTKTLERLKYITQFCGCDYTKLYSPLFLYTRYFHSLIVAHMTWHFTHDKKETIAALFHDVGTPCFAHSIDCVFGDYIEQESSEVKITDIICKDEEVLKYFKEDGIRLEDIDRYEDYQVLENKSPRLCTDRLDGVLHTCYVWLCTNSIEEIKEVYDDLVVLINEDGKKEIGFKSLDIAIKFAHMVNTYALELQGNKDKYVTKYISDMVQVAFDDNKITLDDLYIKKEEDICNIFNEYSSFVVFRNATKLVSTDIEPKDRYYVSYDIKKRNVIPLVLVDDKVLRITDASNEISKMNQEFLDYHDKKYVYIEELDSLR